MNIILGLPFFSDAGLPGDGGGPPAGEPMGGAPAGGVPTAGVPGGGLPLRGRLGHHQEEVPS